LTAHVTVDGRSRYQLAAGDRLDGFALRAVLSRGGMGCVFKAEERATGRTVVLKVPHLHLESDVTFYSRFEREERIGLRLKHPSVAAVLPVSGKSRPYLVMEYVEGRSLYEVMRTDGRLSEARAVAIGRSICEALVYIHAQGVVHRDLKPENVVLDAEDRAHIVDFGVALDFSSRRLTWGGLSSRLGTPEYMSPEQIRGRRGDDRVDVYALGLILYELIAGVPPYEAPTVAALLRVRVASDPRPITDIVPEVSPDVGRVIMRALAVDPRDRYAGAAQLLAALRDPASDVPLAPRDRLRWSLTFVDRLRRTGVVLAVFAALGVLVWQGARTRPARSRPSPPHAAIVAQP
jgi:serine/threonine-protein kinase